MTSTTWISAVVVLLANVLPLFGIDLGSEEVTNLAQTLVNIGAGIYIIYRGWSTGRFSLAGKVQK